MKSISKNVIYNQLPRLFKWPNSDSLIASTYLLLGSFQLFLVKLVDMIWITYDKVGKPNSFGAVPEVARQSVIYDRMKTLKF